MPRGNPRRIFNFLLGETGHGWVADMVAETGADKSTIARLSFAVAKRHQAELKMLINERKDEG